MTKLFQKLFLFCISVIITVTILNGQTTKKPSDSILRSALLQSKQEIVLTANDINYALTDYYISKKSGVEHVYLRQTLSGLNILGTESSVHIQPDGKVLSVSNKFVNSVSKRGSKSPATPKIDPAQAVMTAAQQLGYKISKKLQVVSMENTTDRKTVLSDGGISLSNIPVRLMYYLKEDGSLELVWDLSIESINQTEWYNVRVSALTGKIIDKINWVSSCGFGADHHHDSEQQNKPESIKTSLQNTHFNPPNLLGNYRVLAMPLESPYYGDRTLLNADDIVDLNASPFGWHDTDGISGPEYQTTRGNNVNAYEDGDHSGFQPDGGSNLIFDFPFDSVYSNGNQSESAAITNLFYWSNIIHDVFYEYGFDEPSGNFQENNYGNSGLGSDYVQAEAQDGSGTCNANFATPPDGMKPRMQMYICGNKDGDFDNLVIAHEYGHGISNRLTGGPSNTGCLNNAEQMGEGWSDYFGLMLTMKASDQGTDSRGVGTYLFGQGPNGDGIRTYPYSTDMNINPHTYDNIKTEAVPHGVGSVWCAMLWEMTWALIDDYGFDPDIYNGASGNNIALSLVVEGLRLQPCSPGFVDGRDAILLADRELYGGAHQCLIWEAFAKRGLGYSANQGSSFSRSDGTQAFDVPSDTAAFVAPNDVCLSHPILNGLGGGTPIGGVYSGPGVTDDGNGTTYSFDPVAAGVGIHTITYAVPASSCAPASSSSDDIEVTEPLTLNCPSDIQVSVPQGDCMAIVNFDLPIVTTTCSYESIENFDTIVAPLFPSDWSTTTDQGDPNNWLTASSQSASTPNSAFAQNMNSVSLSSLTSPIYEIENGTAVLSFNLYYNTESDFDGVVLEYSENGGPWSDILSGGGSFMSYPYNRTLVNGSGNPLAGRQAWSGTNLGFQNVVIDLNPAFSGQSVRFRWRISSDEFVAGTGVWVDDVQVEGTEVPQPIITQTSGLPSGSNFPIGTTVNSFTVEDVFGNTASCSFNVEVDGLPFANAAANPNPVCAGKTLFLTASGGITYNWSGPNGFTSTQQNPSISNITLSGSGTYQVMVTNALGCTDTATLNVTVFPSPVAAASYSPDPICEGETLYLTSSGGTSYNWSGPNNFSSNQQNPTINNISTTGAGNYTVTVTNSNGCTSTATVNVVVNSKPHATASATPNPACQGQLTWFTATGGVGYKWSGPNGFNIEGASFGRHMELNMAGVYTVTVTSSAGCTSTASVNVSVTSAPNATANVSPNPACTGDLIQLSSSGGTTYAWSGPAGYTSTQQNPQIPNAKLYHSGTYTVTVTNAAGCTATKSVTLKVNETPVGNAWYDASTSCTGSTLQLHATGGGTYAWTGPGGFTSTSQNPTRANVNASHSGIYTVVITGLYGGCTSSYSVNVQIRPLPAITAWTTTPEVCEGDAAYLFASGGSTYQWSGPYGYLSNFQNPIIYNIPAYMDGIYTVTGTNEYGCTATASVYIDVQTVNAIVNATPNPVPYGGTLYLTASGGTFYQWTGPNGFYSYQQNPIIYKFTQVNAGLYSCVVSTNAGCQDTEIILIQVKNNNAQDEPQLETRIGKYVQVFPNPTSQILKIDSDFDGVMNYTILGMDGNVAGTGQTHSGQEINVHELISGTYFIQWTYTTNGKTESYISKFVKTN